MPSLTQQNKERNLVTQFLRSIHYQSPSGNMPYGNVLNILRAIFESSGQQHLLYLVKLRKLWHDKIDSFMARNAYPRNISVLRQFSVNDDFIKELVRSSVSSEIMQAVEKLNGETFKRSEQFNGKLQKKLKRSLSSEEMELLKHKVRFKPQQTILHLTVYDGSIAQALRFETEAYLRLFDRLLPELKLDDISCHVGDLGQAQYDQRQVALLAKDWHLVTPQEVHQRCMPAFLHRVSRGHAVLVLYVATDEGLAFLKRTRGEDWLVRHLYKKRYELQQVLQKIAFVPKQESGLEQIRLRSVVLGDLQSEKPSSATKMKSAQLTSRSSKTSLSAKEQFALIRENLKVRSHDSNGSA